MKRNPQTGELIFTHDRTELTKEDVLIGTCGAPSRLSLRGHRRVTVDKLSQFFGVDFIESCEGIGIEGVIELIRTAVKLKFASDGEVKTDQSLLVDVVGAKFLFYV